MQIIKLHNMETVLNSKMKTQILMKDETENAEKLGCFHFNIF